MRLIAAACLAIGFATPAHAEWQGFEWGMTEAQVEAARSDVTVTRLDSVKRRKTYPSYSTLGGRWTRDCHEYQVYFYFDTDGKLRDLDVELGELECARLNDVFADRFGKFEEDVSKLGAAKRIHRRWRLGKSAELTTLTVHIPATDEWVCGATIKKPVR